MAQSVDIVIKARDEASAKFGQVGRAAGGLGNTIKRAAMAAGMYFGAREIIGFVKGSIAAYQEQEIAVRHLMDALANLGITGKSAIADLRDFADQIQRTTTISDEAAIEVMSLGVSMGKFSGDTLKAATIAAIGFSKAFKTDFETAMRLVSKSAQGITTGLKRYGIVVDDTMTKAELFHSVLERGSQLYNVATGEINTQAGSVLQLKNQWHDLKEEIGGATSGYVNNFISGAQVAIFFIKEWRLTLEWLWVSFKLGLAEAWAELKYNFGTVMPVLLTYFADNWRQIFTDIWNVTKTIFANMWTNIKDFFVGVWIWLKGGEADWKWTGLLEGFESTLKELPVIAQRELSNAEIVLKEQLGGLTLEMSRKIVESFQPTAIDIKKIVENAVLPEGVIDKAKKSKKEKEQKLAAEESRFLTLAPGARFNNTEKNTGDTAKNTGRIGKLIEVTNKQLGTVGAAIMKLSGATLMVSDFK